MANALDGERQEATAVGVEDLDHVSLGHLFSGRLRLVTGEATGSASVHGPRDPAV
jgi:hypothetical protein